MDKLLWKNQLLEILEYILTPKGLNYNATPKGLIDFHIYSDHIRTAAEEHLVEAALYANDGKEAHIHFTVSEEHIGKFKALMKSVLKNYQKEFNLKYDITYSVQSPATDTVSLDMEGNLVRDNEGNIVFRPGGHGALIHNLNDLKEDLIFIKNIDNVAPDRSKADTVKFKKILAGVLLKTQNQIFNYMKVLSKKSSITDENLNEIEQYIYDHLGYKPKEGLVHTDRKERVAYLKQLLDRPLRVCGMVKNEGEPGGGPFWVEDNEHATRLMIVESAQVNLKDRNQKKIFTQSTHFNPVDIVCSTYNYKGKKVSTQNALSASYGTVIRYVRFKIAKNQTYTVKVRTYLSVNGTTIYGKLSKARAFTTLTNIKLKYKYNYRTGKKNYTVVMPKAKNAKGIKNFTVYISKDRSKGYKKVKTAKPGKNVKISKFKGKAIKTRQIYYIKIVPNLKCKVKSDVIYQY